MSVCAVMMVKNEADIIERTVRNLAAHVDEILIADNLSTDGTLGILAALLEEGLPIVLSADEEVGYWQSRKTTALAHTALERGHQWVMPCDADELWQLWLMPGRIGERLDALEPVYGVAAAAVFNHYATAYDNHAEPDPVRRLGWRTVDRLSLPKVAVRLWPGIVIHAGNHSATPPPRHPQTAVGLLEIRHYPYRSADQFVAKAIQGNEAYRATDLERGLGLHWREYGERIEAEGADVGGRAWFDRYFRYEHPELAGRVGDPQPELQLAPLIYDPFGAW